MLMLITYRNFVIGIYHVYFNTSHVNVNPKLITFSEVTYPYFNTSHVNVNPYLMGWEDNLSTFQYISC